MREKPLPWIEQKTNLLLLTPDDRTRALQNAGQLAYLSKLSNNRGDWIPSGIPRLAICCADACLQENENTLWQARNFQRFQCSKSGERDDALVLAISETSDCLGVVCAVADALGAGGFQPPNPKQLADFLELLNQAREIVFSLPEYYDIVRLNTGFIVPFLCKPPSVGSGSALQIPGALLLPANVPAVVLAECWIHEALHTELHLAEWFEGAPPACATTDLPTPWRTVKRPASLLLHGAYVFSSLLKFMNAMNSSYRQIPSQWYLSATRGAQLLVNNVDETMVFRKSQIVKALQYLEDVASFTQYGKNTVSLIRQQLSDDGSILND